MEKLNRSTASISANYPNKILQFGGGNFLRAFTDWMIDILNDKTGFNGGITIVKPTSGGGYEDLEEQEGLFHVLTNGIRNGELVSETHLVKSVNELVYPYRDWENYLRTAENLHIRFIISNTTEAGIRVDENDKYYDSPPQEFPAKLTRWLYHRFQFFNGDYDRGCIIMPCELLEQNGVLLRTCILRYIQLWKLEKTFEDWINNACIFCNTLVDRIVPGFPSARAEEIWKSIGFRDEWMVDSEPYYLWVIEAPESVRRELPLDKAGLNVVFTSDVKPYRVRKVRILNGAHTAMVPIAFFSGIETVKEAIENEKTGTFIKELIYNEIIPTLDFAEREINEYAAEVIDRFRNPFIEHRIMSIALNSTSKFVARLLPTLKVYVDREKQLPPLMVLSLSALILFYKGRWNGEDIPLRDTEEVLQFFRNHWDTVENGKRATSGFVVAVLGNIDLWGFDLNQIENLSERVEENIISITKHGMIATLDKVLSTINL